MLYGMIMFRMKIKIQKNYAKKIVDKKPSRLLNKYKTGRVKKSKI